MDEMQRNSAMHDEKPVWHSRVPPGVPGAGWFIATVFVFSIVILSGWEWGWWEADHSVAAAPTAPHRMTTGAGH